MSPPDSLNSLPSGGDPHGSFSHPSPSHLMAGKEPLQLPAQGLVMRQGLQQPPTQGLVMRQGLSSRARGSPPGQASPGGPQAPKTRKKGRGRGKGLRARTRAPWEFLAHLGVGKVKGQLPSLPAPEGTRWFLLGITMPTQTAFGPANTASQLASHIYGQATVEKPTSSKPGLSTTAAPSTSGSRAPFSALTHRHGVRC